ncbi:hypothetical protein FRB99_008911 [Tulasnella sp. 403]|nr:hypothetical protein FRB99_008911 [Tulasnella sp. 403]
MNPRRASSSSLRSTAVLLLCVLSCSVRAGRLASLYSNEITYCSLPSAIVVQQFEARYVKDNSSLVFDITASTRENTNANVTAKITLNAYGLEPIDVSFNLCEVSKSLCPLPMYNFSGAGSVPLPTIQEKIPAIAYVIPDLEAAATSSSGRVALPASPLLYRFLTMFFFIQHIVSTALLDLNYPLAYRSFAVNFAWSFGLFGSAMDSRIQRSMNNLREKTGSKDAHRGVQPPIAFSNRELSPYNGHGEGGLAFVVNATEPIVTSEAFISPATVLPSSPDVLPAGIPTYTNTIGIATGNAFLSMFYTALILLAAFCVLAGIGYAFILLVERKRPKKPKSAEDDSWTVRYWAAVRVIGTRVAFGCLIPICTLSFFQWTFGDSWLAVLFAVAILLAELAYLAFSSFKLFISHRRRAASDHPHRLSYHAAYTEPYTSQRWFYTAFIVLPLALAKSLFTSFAKSSGMVQVVAFIVLDLAALVLLVAFRPGVSRASDVLEGFIAFVRLALSACLVTFVERVNVKPIPRAAVGFAMALFESIVIVVLFFELVWRIGEWVVRSRRRGALESDGASGFTGVPMRRVDADGRSIPEGWSIIDLENYAADTKKRHLAPPSVAPSSLHDSAIAGPSNSSHIGDAKTEIATAPPSEHQPSHAHDASYPHSMATSITEVEISYGPDPKVPLSPPAERDEEDESGDKLADPQHAERASSQHSRSVVDDEDGVEVHSISPLPSLPPLPSSRASSPGTSSSHASSSSRSLRPSSTSIRSSASEAHTVSSQQA